MTRPADERLGRLPSVSEILRHAEIASLVVDYGRETVVDWIRAAIDQLRSAVRHGACEADPSGWIARTIVDVRHAAAHRELLRLGPVINATGVVLHTNLGRAALSDAAIDAMQLAAGYANVELVLGDGERQHRGHQLEPLWRELTGAEDALVVNNCAAATLLALQALAAGREVVVSRGQLIEIGGSYRLPDVFQLSGAKLREVGTTNRTRLSDYEAAIGPDTAALLRVHPSNYRVVGFVEFVGIAELAELAHRRGLLAIDDVGSGALVDLTSFGLPAEPMVRDSIRSNADLVVFSGDKLLGGPQCGVILGRRNIIQRLRESPLARALRVDKLTIAALQATLEIYRFGNPLEEIPALEMLTRPADRIEESAQRLFQSLSFGTGAAEIRTLAVRSAVGAGAFPTAELPSTALMVNVPGLSPDALARRLRTGQPRVLPRIENGTVLFDMRTVRSHELEELAAAIRQAVWT